ncbi:MAG: DNA-directed RNA polymerase subunit alpha [Candidatus Yanofskybacteria bacterium]|nr:DNA-directed RNA polymerase subunit alpha [Candidatus Yanofskybacteria bacterium]
MIQLPDTVKVIEREGNKAKFEISPLMPGYGATIANPLRRVLLSSLGGAAVTSIKIRGVEHQFSSMPGVMEDLIEIILNVKKIRFKSFSDQPVVVTLDYKGEGEVTAGDIKLPAEVEVINPEQHIATVSEKRTEFNMELTVEKGIGYVPTEQRQKDKLAIGVIAVDAIFSPVRNVNFTIDDIRVGQRIDYNRIILELETDGSISPEEAFKSAAEIIVNHFSVLGQIEIPEEPAKPAKKARKVKAVSPEI